MKTFALKALGWAFLMMPVLLFTQVSTGAELPDPEEDTKPGPIDSVTIGQGGMPELQLPIAVAGDVCTVPTEPEATPYGIGAVAYTANGKLLNCTGAPGGEGRWGTVGGGGGGGGSIAEIGSLQYVRGPSYSVSGSRYDIGYWTMSAATPGVIRTTKTVSVDPHYYSNPARVDITYTELACPPGTIPSETTSLTANISYIQAYNAGLPVPVTQSPLWTVQYQAYQAPKHFFCLVITN